MTFTDDHLELQHLVRELVVLRKHNQSTVLDQELLLFAEGALVLLALERFLRTLLGADATEQHTLPNLLEMAFSKKRNLLRAPGDPATVVREVNGVRRTLIHGNYEQAAREAGCADVREYFRTQYTPEVERLFRILDFLMAQIDPHTGQPRAPLPSAG